MAVLVIADHDGSTVRDTTNKTVTAALGLSSDVDVLVVGQGAQAAADSAAKIAGVRKVLLAESAGLGHGLAEAVEATVVPLAAEYDAILTPASTDGKNFAPRIAAKLDVAPISDIVEVVSPDTFVRPIYAGNALETGQSSDAKKVLTVRPTAVIAAASLDCGSSLASWSRFSIRAVLRVTSSRTRCRSAASAAEFRDWWLRCISWTRDASAASGVRNSCAASAVKRRS